MGLLDQLNGQQLTPEPKFQGVQQLFDLLKRHGSKVVANMDKRNKAVAGLLDNPESPEGLSAALDMAGLAPLGMFAGVGAKTADLVKQGLAEKMLKAGDDPAKVWKETGWGIGPDGKWRFEIPDNKSFYRGAKAAGSSYADDVLTHPELYDAHPSLGQIRVREFDGIGGGIDEAASKMDVGIKGNAAETALHELQHGVQQKEKFARGGSPDEFESAAKSYRNAAIRQASNEDGMKRALQNGGIDPTNGFTVKNYEDNLARIKGQMQELESKGADRDPFWSYQRLGGEAEARLTQSRMNMDAGQRAAQYPWDKNYFKGATGVPLDQLIIRMGDQGLLGP